MEQVKVTAEILRKNRVLLEAYRDREGYHVFKRNRKNQYLWKNRVRK
jgi:hypothetical protein